jgi:hypothetical protein
MMRTGRVASGAIVAVVAVSMVAVPAIGAKKKPPQKPGATYSAQTSQGTSSCQTADSSNAPCSIFIAVSKDGKNVKAAQVYWYEKCDDGVIFRSSTVFRNLKITKGKYSKSATYDETLGDGSTAKNSVTTHGTFKHKNKKYTVSGDFSITSQLTYHEGGGSNCTSGKVTFLAKIQ